MNCGVLEIETLANLIHVHFTVPHSIAPVYGKRRLSSHSAMEKDGLPVDAASWFESFVDSLERLGRAVEPSVRGMAINQLFIGGSGCKIPVCWVAE